MDTNYKQMKKSELKEYIKNRIKETFVMDVPEDPSQLDPAKIKNYISQARTREKDTSIGGPKKPVKFLEEDNINEMSRPAVVFKVAEDFKEKAKDIKTGGPVSPTKLADTLKFLEGKSEVTGPEIAAGLGFVNEKGKALMPRIYPIFAALISVDALTATGGTETEEVSDKEEEEFISGGPAPEPEEEPVDANIEKAQAVTLDPVTQKATSFTIDNDSLIQSIIRSYKDSKIRLGAIREEEGDLSAADYKKALQKGKEASTDILAKRLDTLVTKLKELEPEVLDKVLTTLDFKFKSVDAASISKILSKKLGKEIKPASVKKADIDIVDLDDEELMEDTGVEDISYEPTFKDYENIYEAPKTTGGRRFIPKEFNLPSELRGEHFKLLKRGSEYVLLVSELAKIALDAIERGRTSFEKEQGLSALTRLFKDKMPAGTRMAIKNGIKFGKTDPNNKMIVANLTINGVDDKGDILIKNPFHDSEEDIVSTKYE